MNVAFDAWIPVVTVSGERKLASTCDVLTDGAAFADLAVRPHERVSLMRLVLCVAHAALNGPKDYEEWREVPERLPHAATKYLAKWKDSFELFDKKKPWLQVAELDISKSSSKQRNDDGAEWSPLSRLCFTRASGINSTLFDHESNGAPMTVYTKAETALNLLTFQNFFVAGGRASLNTAWGRTKMLDHSRYAYPKGGPCSGKSILFTFIRGKNLQETVRLNLNTYEDLSYLYGEAGKFLGKPLWELPIGSPNDTKAIENATRTHLGRLVPQTRMLRISEDCTSVLVGPGFVYPKFQEEKDPFSPDQFSTTVKNSEGKVGLLSARPNISLWRELHCLLVRAKDSADSSRGPLCLLNVSEQDDCDVVVNAMMTNPTRPAEIVYLLESVFHLSSKLRSARGISTYESEIQHAEVRAWQLKLAIGDYAKTYFARENSKEKKGNSRSGGPSEELKSRMVSAAMNHYWTTLERNVSLLYVHIESIDGHDADSTLDSWRKMLFKAALDSYRVACGEETPRQMRAFAKGWKRLTTFKEEPSGNSNQEEKEVA